MVGNTPNGWKHTEWLEAHREWLKNTENGWKNTQNGWKHTEWLEVHRKWLKNTQNGWKHRFPLFVCSCSHFY